MPENKPTLSLCMIVKNEEKFLPQCLDSVKEIVDEIVVVDTGSDDRTVEIAESYGCRVYHHPWEGNFSKARNISLGYATGDWILVMDPDEKLEAQDIPILKKVLTLKEVDVIYFLVMSENPFGWTRHYSHRVFRRGIAHYEGIVHNQLIYQGNKVDTNIRLYHYGYNLSEKEMKAKFDRTQALLKKQLEEDPLNPFAQFNYLRVLRARELWQEAAESGLKALELCKERMTETHLQMIVNDTAYSLVRADRSDEAVDLARPVLESHPDNLDLLFTMAAAFVQQKKYKEALVPLRHFLKVKEQEKETTIPRFDRLIVDTFTLDHRVWANIADCHFELLEFESGLEAARKAIELKPEAAVYKITLARNLVQLGRFEEASNALQQAMSDPEIKEDFFMKWYILCRHFPELGDSVEILRQGIRHFPESDTLQNNLGYYAVDFDTGMAEQAWKSALEINPSHLGAFSGLMELYIKEKKESALNHLVSAGVNVFASDPRHLQHIGKVLIENEKYELGIVVMSRLLDIDPSNYSTLADISTCYVKLGQYEAAYLGYQSVLKADPENEGVIRNMKILEQLMKSAQ